MARGSGGQGWSVEAQLLDVSRCPELGDRPCWTKPDRQRPIGPIAQILEPMTGSGCCPQQGRKWKIGGRAVFDHQARRIAATAAGEPGAVAARCARGAALSRGLDDVEPLGAAPGLLTLLSDFHHGAAIRE